MGSELGSHTLSHWLLGMAPTGNMKPGASKYLLAQRWIRKIDRKLQKDLGLANRQYWQSKRRLWVQRAAYWMGGEHGS